MFKLLFCSFLFACTTFPQPAQADQEFITWTEIPAGIPIQWVDLVVPVEKRTLYTSYLILMEGLDASYPTVISVQITTEQPIYDHGNYYETGFSQWNGSLFYVDANGAMHENAYSLNLGTAGFQVCPDLGERPSGQWTHLGCTGELRFYASSVVSGEYTLPRFESKVSKGEWGFGPIPAGHRLGQLFGSGYWQPPASELGKPIAGFRFRSDTRGSTNSKLISGKIRLYGIKGGS